MIPRFGESPQKGRRYIRRPGVYAILPREGQLLLTWQATPWPEVQLPGGGVDPGESPLQALHREVFEETGWKIGGVRRLGAFRRFVYMPDYDMWAEKLCTIYLARPVRALGPPSEAGHRPLWMPPEQAADKLGNPGDKQFVRRVMSPMRGTLRLQTPL